MAFEHHFVGVSKMVGSVNRSAAKMEGQFPSKSALNLRPSHSAKKNGKLATVADSRYKEAETLNNEARELEARSAGILSAYDDLIENNLRRIKILEEMAQSLYREWFVHFRFPLDPSEASAKAGGHESVKLVDSALGQIPEGWEVKSAGELIGFHVGGGWGKDVQDENHSEPAFVIRGTDIPSSRLCDVSSVPFRYHTVSNLRSRRLGEGDIIFEVSGGSKGQPVGRALFVSRSLLKSFDGADVMCASFCKLLRTDADIIAPQLLFYHLQEIYEDGRIDQYQVQSTGITNFKFAPFLDQELIVVPPRSLQEKLVRSVAPSLQLIQTLGQKCQNLRRTRDLLLPQLLSPANTHV